MSSRTWHCAHIAILDGVPTIGRRFARRTPDAVATYAEMTGSLDALKDEDVATRVTSDAVGQRPSFSLSGPSAGCLKPLLIGLVIAASLLTVERRVSHEGMISVGGNLYSVPDATRRRTLEVQNHPKELRIFEDGALIAVHPVLVGRNQRRLDPSHRRPPPPASPPAPGPEAAPGGVGVRPLSFYDAVARRLAGGSAAS